MDHLRFTPSTCLAPGRWQTEIRHVAFDDTSDVGRYWAAVSKFLDTNNIKHLEPFWGQGVRDVFGAFCRFEVRPNVLRNLDSIGELNFIEIHADVAR